MNKLGLAATALALGGGCAPDGLVGDLQFDADAQEMDLHLNYGQSDLCPDSESTRINHVGVDEIDPDVFNPNKDLRLERDGFADAVAGDRVLGNVDLVVDDFEMDHDKDAGEMQLVNSEQARWHLCFDSDSIYEFVSTFVDAAEQYDSVEVSCIGNRQIEADMEARY